MTTIARMRSQALALEATVCSPVARSFLHAVPTLTVPAPAGPPSAGAEGSSADVYYDCFGADAPRPSLRGRTPLAYVRALERLAPHGLATLEGLRVLDFGYGSVGALRLFAACGAHAVGVDADLAMAQVYCRPEDQGPFPHGAPRGTVTLAHGRFPADPAIVARAGSGFDLVLAKNVLKRGMVHPSEPVEAWQRVDLGVTDEEFLHAIARVLSPGGLFAIYNLSPRIEPGAPYVPHADGACPFSRSDLERAGLEVLELDASDGPGVASMARALGWDTALGIDAERDVISTVTVARLALA